jgi:hypothetical protein
VQSRPEVLLLTAHLESTGISNQSLYHRHGFQVRDELR